MRNLNIANVLRAAGLRVVECAGWQERGSVVFNPRGSVNHHTAGPSRGTAPSLNGVIHGHPGSAPGPLAHALQSREPDGNDIFYVVASGKANHAGLGKWQGLSGNSSVYGLEIEHTGVEPLPEHRQMLAARFHAALARGNYYENMVCQHREWAPTRKIDAATEVDPNRFRLAVGQYIRGYTSPPESKPEEEEMWVVNFKVEEDKLVTMGLPFAYKSARVDFWLDVDHSKGSSVWAVQEYEGGAEGIGLWEDGHKWELYIPGHQRSFTSSVIKPNICAIGVQNKGPEGPLLVTISGT